MKKIHLNRALAAKKKKLTILFALLCVSVMSWADCYTATQNTNENAYPLTLTVEKLGDNQTRLSVTSTHSTLTGVHVGSTCQGWGDGVVANGENIINNLHIGWTNNNNVWTRIINWKTYPTGTLKFYLVMYRNNSGGGSDIMSTTYDGIDASQSCAGGGSTKPSPELSLNADRKTLEIDASAETFQIEPTKAEGSGTVSYATSDEAIATVSNTGLVTAVGNGTATITVSVAENDDYAADSKTLKVEVIDWPNIGWLPNGENAYKLHISPSMGGNQRIDNGNLWIEFPDAVIGDISIETNGGGGAWRTFAPSNFTGYRTQFTAVWRGNTYTFTVYRAFNGVNLAKGMPSYAGHAAFPAQNANDGNKGSRWGSAGAKHYSTEGDLAEDWWSVDLGAFYEVSSIKTLYEGATPKNYSFYTSPNNDSWIEIDRYNTVPQHVGNTDADYNEYTYSPGKVARYVKIFAREAVQADFANGVSIYEFEVYGKPAENVDVNAPVLASAAVSGTPTTSEIKIAVSATDTEDGAISLYRVRESSLKMDRNFTAVDGKLTFSGLVDDTDYSFTITALDNIGNQSNAIVVNASTAVDPANPATMAPEPPTRSVDDVRAIYSDAYADILMHDFTPERTDWGSVSATRRVKGGNNYLLYDISSGTNITWGSNDGGANAIVAKDGYHAVGTTGLDASGMEYLHVDIWSLVALKNVNVKINDAVFIKITHDGGGWQSYDLEMAGSAVDFTNIRWLKLDDITSDVTRGKAAVDNYYFWKAPSGVKAVVVSSNDNSWGTATATVGGAPAPATVATGTEVTFTATPTSADYDFAYWQIGDTKIETNPYTVAITANTNAKAIFEPHRTTYCRSVITADNGAKIYMTAKKTGAVQDGTGYPQYRLEFEGMKGYAITGAGNFDVWIGNVNGSSGNTQFAPSAWTFDDNTTLYPYGMIYAEFYAEDWRQITFPYHYFYFAPGGVVELNAKFPTASLINWNNSCVDKTAPILETPVAEALNESTIRLSLSATDDYSNTIWYHITCTAAGVDETITGASGAIITKEYTGLTTGTSYEFFITAADGSNPATAYVSDAQKCSATPVGDTQAPVITSFTATASYGYVDLSITATDDMVGDLTYTITYGAEAETVVGAAGSETTKRIFALPNTPLSFSVVATDAASRTSDAAVANATTLTIPASPIPTREAAAVYSVYSDAYTPAVSATFNRTNWGGAPVAIEDDYILYTMSANTIIWGNNDGNAGHGNIDGLSGYTHDATPGLDVSAMQYIHFDVWCDAADQLNTVNINDVTVAVPTTRTKAGQWVSFDVDITGVELADRQNVRWLKFHPFNTTNCLVAIDNVYFWSAPKYTRADSWMAPGELGTVCYPEGLRFAGAKLYQMAGTDANGKFVFDEVEVLQPGVPYLFEATANTIQFYATPATRAENAGTSNGMVGTFSEMTIPQNSPNIYYFSGKKFYAVTARQTDLTVPANRAYVDLTTPQPATAPKPGIRRITFDVEGTNTTTGVDQLNASDAPAKAIINGHLFILRGDKMYDATGRMVK